MRGVSIRTYDPVGSEDGEARGENEMCVKWCSERRAASMIEKAGRIQLNAEVKRRRE